ncbi:hypothetical protein MKZ38_009474 [Zalerion maritima]|uniref:Uncharacterized protein n=1 Tax=Zalerion maritima TaxID=339359 RepID=A0AAD5WN50_9PEZI|nr:hypothetical protein MKZ38_009474 [Zalerion maritima]
MQFLTIAAFAATASAWAMTGTGGPHYTTETVTAYTTYCPEPTTFCYEDKTYTITEATTLTITDCPDHGCTVVKPVYTSTAVDCGSGGCGGYVNTTVPYWPTGTGSSYTPSPTPGCSGAECGSEEEGSDTVETSNAGKVVALSGAALAGVLALAAAL